MGSIFDNGSSVSMGGATTRARKSSRQRSVSDVIKPRLEELPEAVLALDNEAFQVEDMEFEDELEPSHQLFLDRTRLETISENQDSPNITLARHCFERRPDVRRIFGPENPSQQDGPRSQDEANEELSRSSASFSDPVFV